MVYGIPYVWCVCTDWPCLAYCCWRTSMRTSCQTHKVLIVLSLVSQTASAQTDHHGVCLNGRTEIASPPKMSPLSLIRSLKVIHFRSEKVASSTARRSSHLSTAVPSSTPPFEKILIANRGEIACRVIKTCRRLGIRTVAIFSSIDGPESLHARLADEAYLIGTGPEASSSYLLSQQVINICKESGAQAIHPGYGFLSENANFVRQVDNNNIVFIGPPSSAITAMGSKSKSKEIMTKANVPCTPGFIDVDPASQEPDFLLQQAISQVGFPCLIKATMGGGGKGMRLVKRPSDFLDALHSCKRESFNAFGNETVILEKFIVNPRHVEVQVCCDTHGNAVYLHERDCSVQRRHQKVLEEAPAPGLPEEVRRELGEVAVRAAKAVGYVNAGTVEFLMDENKDFYFCEMNTRLQVEHPVTEFITGVDLVEWQLRVAAGEELPIKDQSMIPCNGHAMECRVYAENPARNFLPAAGTLRHLKIPQSSGALGGGVRVDTGVVQGDKISVFYDPMISKLIVHAPTRDEAIQKLLLSLKSYQIVGTPTNLKFVEKCVDHPAFRKGGVNTGFLEEFAEDVKVPDEAPLPSPIGLCLASLAVLLSMERRIGAKEKNLYSPWSNLSGSWRIGVPFTRTISFMPYLGSMATTATDDEKVEQTVVCTSNKDGSFNLSLVGDDNIYHTKGVLFGDGSLEATINENRYTNVTSVELDEDGGSKSVHLWAAPGRILGKEGESSCSVFLPSRINTKHASMTETSGIVKAPMPGKVVRVSFAPGEKVKTGQVLIHLEAMKMEHAIISPSNGTLKTVSCSPGDLVSDGEVLAVVGPE